jgi:hypothetical protein
MAGLFIITRNSPMRMNITTKLRPAFVAFSGPLSAIAVERQLETQQ